MKIKLLFFFLLGIKISFAQIIKGTILDEQGKPVENVFILNENTLSHAHTNELGRFSISNTSTENILKISGLGYKTKKLLVSSDADISVNLEKDIFKLDEVIIQPTLSSTGVISKIDLKTNPVNSSQEILRKVPGLFIGQHAGGGKAEQLFLRGFDIDHGTDINLSVDGMPVNMVSHAHGQGYADLHFVIPETVNAIDYGKGTYYADKGNFTTAGYVGFKTKDQLENSSVTVDVGQFNTQRIVGLFDLLQNVKNQHAYFATEILKSDGPFDTPQNFKRINLFGKYTAVLADKSLVSMQVSTFTSKWDASGQIPQRLVDKGVISRFGAVDDTEGGKTSRTNVNMTLLKPIDERTFIKANAYYSKYQFELYSNFTFFLNDSINGDQIKQKEDRDIYGLNAELNRNYRVFDKEAIAKVGIGFRTDQVNDVELSNTINRQTTINRLRLGDIDETNMFTFVSTEIEINKLKIIPALRLDYFQFNYQDKLQLNYKTQSVQKTFLSPKLNFIYTSSNTLQLYAKSGIGYHSNDTRVVVAQDGKEVLPAAYGTDLGTIWKPFSRLLVNSALWYLYLEQEFVYVGDAGIVEPSGRSRRLGADLGLRFQLNKWLFADYDVNYAFARSIDEPIGENYIPLAADLTMMGGLSLSNFKGFSGGFRTRYLKDRPANEDNSIVAEGYTITDVNLNYTIKKLTIGCIVENVFNVEWKETQFATESRLKGEDESVEEIHFTTGVPFFLKVRVGYAF